MKKSLLVFAFAILAACATTDLLTQETIAMQSVTSARTLSQTAMTSGKITVAKDAQNQAYLTVTANAIKAAVAAGSASGVASGKAQADAVAATLK